MMTLRLGLSGVALAAAAVGQTLQTASAAAMTTNAACRILVHRIFMDRYPGIFGTYSQFEG
jgi:hypothetical protein